MVAVEETMDSITNQLNHISVVQSEIVNILADSIEKSKGDLINNQDIKVKENLLHQSQIVCSWVNKSLQGMKGGSACTNYLKI